VTRALVISVLLIAFSLVAFLLSGIGILNFSSVEILCFALIIAGMGLVYIGFGDKADLFVFSGTVLFLVGIVLLIILSFEVIIENTAYVLIILLISAVGFFMIYINRPSRKINVLISLLLFISSAVLILTRTKFEPTGFVHAIIPLLNIYWPVIVIFLLLVILLKKK
jgi:hypothetical protein